MLAAIFIPHHPHSPFYFFVLVFVLFHEWQLSNNNHVLRNRLCSLLSSRIGGQDSRKEDTHTHTRTHTHTHNPPDTFLRTKRSWQTLTRKSHEDHNHEATLHRLQNKMLIWIYALDGTLPMISYTLRQRRQYNIFTKVPPHSSTSSGRPCSKNVSHPEEVKPGPDRRAWWNASQIDGLYLIPRPGRR